jgi:hypothetical protein
VKAKHMPTINTCIEIFAGTKSFTKLAKMVLPDCERFITIDIDSRFECTYTCDIIVFDYQRLIPPDTHLVTHIWCSPPCTEYSKAKTTKQRDLEGADTLVQKGLKMIRFYQKFSNPALTWYLENPRTGLLKTRAIMRPLTTYYDANYCRYAPWGMPSSLAYGPTWKQGSHPSAVWGAANAQSASYLLMAQGGTYTGAHLQTGITRRVSGRTTD